MKIVIAALVRGYDRKQDYNILIKRNNNIFRKITSKSENKIDQILFHEGNISKEDESFINSKSPESINFVDVSEDFDYDKKLIEKIPDLERFGIGYRLMCRFNFLHIWKYIKDFDYLIRIDEDIMIKKFNVNFINNIDKDFVFGTAKFSNETHKYTNQSLPDELMKIFQTNNKNFYNNKFPYTNFYISKISFWNEIEINNALEKIANNDLQFIHRWGDLPIIGSVLNHNNVKINLLEGIIYSHLSHKNKLKISKVIKS